MELNLTEVIGISGAALVLLAFAMNQTNKWTNSNIKYDVINLLGSALLLTYGLILEAYPFVVLNVIWALFSLKDVIKKIMSKN